MIRDFDPFEKNNRNRDTRDDEKPSWRDLDRKRDQSRHREGPAGGGGQPKRRDLEAAFHKKQLEDLFKPGANLTDDQKKQLKKIRTAKGDAEINSACQAYLKKNEMPRDWDNLLLFLDATDATIVVPAMQQMMKLLPSQPKPAQNNFKQQLKLIKMMATDRDIRQEAEKLFNTIA